MTTHSITCTNCGHRIQADTLEELTAEPRTCPLCGLSSWEVQEHDTFPCSARERKIIYQKILQIGNWCITEKPCDSGVHCPLKPFCTTQNYERAFIRWVMEAQI